MNYIDFIRNTVYVLDEDIFILLKDSFINKYLFFDILSSDKINIDTFSEKLADYIEKLEIKTGKSFDKQISIFTNSLYSLIKGKLVTDSRAKKYADLVNKRINHADLTIEELVDYSRVMLCLYSSYINSDSEELSNFNLDIQSITVDKIIDSMQDEKVAEIELLGVAKWSKKNKFKTKELYSSVTFTFMLIYIFYCYMVNFEIKGDY